MKRHVRGVLAGLLVGLATLGGSRPDQPLPAAVLFFGGLWLESYALGLTARYRFTPAVPIYLTAAVLAGVGPGVVASLLVLDAVRRRETPFLDNLGQALAVAASTLAIVAARSLEQPQLAAVMLGSVVYLVLRLAVDGTTAAGESPEGRALWRQLRLRVRPLEIGLAALAPALTVAADVHPLYPLAFCPLLVTAQLGAENILLQASDHTIAEALRELKSARHSALTAKQQLVRAESEKQLLEGFAAHLAARPNLRVTAKTLVATVRQLMPVDNVAVFLGQPLEPFSYKVSEAHREALQGAGLTGLREPLVDRAGREGKAVSRKAREENEEALFSEDKVAVALPLGSSGVLYAGRQQARPFSKTERERLLWLAGKAQVALDAAFQANEIERQRRRQQQHVQELRRKVEWLASLVQGAEQMAATLDPVELCQRLAGVLQKVVPHARGRIQLEKGRSLDWGGEMRADPELLAAVAESGRPIQIEDLTTSRFAAPAPGLTSLVASPLTTEQGRLGFVILGSDKGAFPSESIDLLMLLCAQAAVALSKARLHHEVVEARQQLMESQDQLVQSSKMTALGQMAAGVAHELNSPLGALVLLLDETAFVLRENPDAAEKMLEEAQSALDKSRQIVDRFMTYTRTPTRENRLFSLRDLLRDTLEFLKLQTKNAGVSIRWKAGEDAMVRGEREPLQQVLTNLIINGCQAMEESPAGRKMLDLGLSRENGRAVITIQDQGCGIASEHLDRIFDPFFTTKPVGRGTGLGLWASHRITTEHQGTLEVRSEPGRGSLFTLSLPVAEA